MPTKDEIRAKYKALHDDLSDQYYNNHTLTKEEFDLQHGKIWDDCQMEVIANA